MRIRTVLLSTAAAASLLFGMQFSAPVSAQAYAELRPQGAWAVSHIKDSQSGGAGYCALARRFDGGAILTVARNQATETSFALDFQSSTFTPGQSVNLMLDPGADEVRNFQVTPISGRAAVVKLGVDAPFFNALERTGQLRVEVGGDAHAFDFSDFHRGEAKLSSCLASALVAYIEPAAGEVSAPDPDAAYAGKNKDLIMRMNDRIAALEENNQSLRAKIARTQNESRFHAGSASEFDTLMIENARLKEKLLQRYSSGSATKPDRRVAALEAENASLQARLREVSAKKDHDTIDLQQRIIALESQNAVLAEQLDFAKTVTRKNQDAVILRLQGENEDLRAAIKGGDTDLLAQMQGQIEAMRRENQRLRRSAEASQSGVLRQKQAEIALLKESQQRTIGTLKQTIEMLQDESRKKSMQIAQMQDTSFQFASLESDNRRLKGQVEMLQKNLQQQYDIVQQERSSVRSIAADLAARTTELENALLVASQVAGLETEIVIKDKLLRELSASGVEHNALMAEKQVLDESMGHARVLYDQNAAHEHMIRDLQTQVVALSTALELQQGVQQEVQHSEGLELAAFYDQEEDVPKPARKPQRLPEVERAARDIEQQVSDQLAEQLDREYSQSKRIADTSNLTAADIMADIEPSAGLAQDSPLHQARGLNEAQRYEEDLKRNLNAPAPIEEDALKPEPVVQQERLEPVVASLNEVPAAPQAPRNVIQQNGPLSLFSVLGTARITTPALVNEVANAPQGVQHAYTWKSGGVFGSGEVRLLPAVSGFDQAVKTYFKRSEDRCGGDFAVIPDNSKQRTGVRVDSYEIACVGAGVSAGASLVFYNDGNVLNIVAHEAPADQMDGAMILRDRVFENVLKEAGS